MDPFRRDELRARGFEGFIGFKDVNPADLPTQPGVYVILRENDALPSFLTRSPAGWFKGKDPTVPVAELEESWPDGAHCVYIGKAASPTPRRHLRKRLTEFRRYGDGEPVGHQGGRRIWQLADADDFIVAWMRTPDRDPDQVESELIAEFVETHGRRPIGNRTKGRSGDAMHSE